MPSEKRERQRQRRAEARAAREKAARRQRLLRGARRGLLIALVVLAAGVIVSLATRGGDDDGDTTLAETTITAAGDTTAPADTSAPADTTPPADTAPTDTVAEDSAITDAADEAFQAFRALPVACGGEAPPPPQVMSFDGPEDQGIDPESSVTATLATSCGPIEVELFPDQAPTAVNSFVFLARQGYFDGTVSHRIVPGFVFQAGDPTATGSGGPGYRFEDELPAGDNPYPRGVLAMANSGPNTNGSQFFIVFQDAALPPDYTVFGEVTDGLDVLDSLEAVPVAGQQPLEAVYLERVEVSAG